MLDVQGGVVQKYEVRNTSSKDLEGIDSLLAKILSDAHCLWIEKLADLQPQCVLERASQHRGMESWLALIYKAETCDHFFF